MECLAVMSQLGYECQDLGQDTLRIWSPFSYGGDGELVGLYVEKIDAGYRVSDMAESLMHAHLQGVNISKKRLDTIRLASPGTEISAGGAISAVVSSDHLGEGIACVLSASLAVGHFESVWRPRQRSDSFSKRVGAVLVSAVGEQRVERNVTVVGGSGHQLEIPFVLSLEARRIYVQPVAANDDGVDWDGVYEGLGKMFDVQDAGAPNASRLIVIENGPAATEQARAMSLLARSATVVDFEKLPNWAMRLTA